MVSVLEVSHVERADQNPSPFPGNVCTGGKTLDTHRRAAVKNMTRDLTTSLSSTSPYNLDQVTSSCSDVLLFLV